MLEVESGGLREEQREGPGGLLQQLAQSPRSLAWMRGVVEAKIDNLREKFELAGVEGLKIAAIGSVATGHFRGPKHRTHSWNSASVPALYNYVVEGDISIVLPETTDPFSPEMLSLLKRVTGGEMPDKLINLKRWGKELSLPYFYAYEDLGGDLGLEWEITIHKEPHVEIAEYWNAVFDPHEVEWQGEIRATLRAMNADYWGEVQVVKGMQCAECRWRIVSAFALAQLKREGDPILQGVELPDFSAQHPPELLRPIIDGWLAGRRDIPSAEPPTRELPTPARLKIERIDSNLLSAPSQPAWVQTAEAVQRLLRLKRGE